MLVKSKFMKLDSGHIRFDLSDYYGDLYAGDCLEVFADGKWRPARMEYGDNWYLFYRSVDSICIIPQKIRCSDSKELHYSVNLQYVVPIGLALFR